MGNRYGFLGTRSKDNQVNLEYSHSINLGDSLSPVVVEWMLGQRQIDPQISTDQTRHLMAIGSIVGRGIFDTTIWGSGVHRPVMIEKIAAQKGLRELDIRAVRGPRTRSCLIDCGFACPEVYGDPAILMPLIFDPRKKEGVSQQPGKTILILHHANSLGANELPHGVSLLDIKTTDYKAFIRELCTASKVIAASLHGIILAETYDIPAVFLCKESVVEEQMMKYIDWYESTGRSSFSMAHSVSEACLLSATPLPALGEMRSSLMKAFPYDLWMPAAKGRWSNGE